jgi:hypothetical protein
VIEKEGAGMRAVLYIIGTVLGGYLVVRAIAEPFVIDLGDPAAYANDWGGPSLFGVLAVHCGPGLVVLGIGLALLIRRLGGSRKQHDPPASPGSPRVTRDASPD